MKSLKIVNIVIRISLGILMVLGGFKKFEKPVPPPTQLISKIEADPAMKTDTETLKIHNYIFGLKQSGFFWQMLGVLELAAGVLLISQVMGFAGAVIALPLTLNIFLFHLFLEPHEKDELVKTSLMLLANAWLIAWQYKEWKHLLVAKVRTIY